MTEVRLGCSWKDSVTSTCPNDAVVAITHVPTSHAFGACADHASVFFESLAELTAVKNWKSLEAASVF